METFERALLAICSANINNQGNLMVHGREIEAANWAQILSEAV